MTRVAEDLGWSSRREGPAVQLRAPVGVQPWVFDTRGDAAVCAVAVRDESWLLGVPSVRVEDAAGRWLVIDGCRRFSVAECDAGWHGDRPCFGHAEIEWPDPFPFERFVRSVGEGRIEPVFIDGLVDPADIAPQRWTGWVWMRAEEASVAREWYGERATPHAAKTSAELGAHWEASSVQMPGR